MTVVVAVEARDEAGQHARVGCVHVASDESDTHAWERMHPKAPEHLDMGVASPQEDQVLPCTVCFILLKALAGGVEEHTLTIGTVFAIIMDPYPSNAQLRKKVVDWGTKV